MIYLASPYNSPHAAIRLARYEAVLRVAANMMAKGEQVFCPIAYGHQFTVAGVFPTPEARWEYFKLFDYEMLFLCEKLVVLKLPGWDESVGVAEEIKWAEQEAMPIEYMEP